jgi:hypothetical protein
MIIDFTRYLRGALIVPIPTLGDFKETLRGAFLLDQGGSPASFICRGQAVCKAGAPSAIGALSGKCVAFAKVSSTVSATGKLSGKCTAFAKMAGTIIGTANLAGVSVCYVNMSGSLSGLGNLSGVAIGQAVTTATGTRARRSRRRSAIF